MTKYMRGARPKGSAKPTKGLYKKRGANKDTRSNNPLRGGTTGKVTVFKSKKYVSTDKKKSTTNNKKKSTTNKKFFRKTDSTPTILKKSKNDPISNITVKPKKVKKPRFGDKSLITKNTDMSKTKVIDTTDKRNLLERMTNKKSGGQALVQSLYDKG